MTSQLSLVVGLREHRDSLRRQMQAIDEAIRIIEGSASGPPPLSDADRPASSIRGRKPAGVDVVTEIARATSTSIRQIAREIGMREDTLKAQVSRNAVMPSVALRVEEWAKKKMKTE